MTKEHRCDQLAQHHLSQEINCLHKPIVVTKTNCQYAREGRNKPMSMETDPQTSAAAP